ncbi:serine/threonine-protein kinase [Actinoplanes sp. CA-030573]|uniref:serine/threonine-protein kinase n=1 Tax=Actinoplanes sp. CA-030573 TaxID=3239898 RepID=UPI003D8C456E
MRTSLSMSGVQPSEAATADLSGRCVGNSYVLVCPVGHGATGTVWRGIDRSTGEPVAVKLLHEGLLRQPKLVIRFVQERTILMMMRHENIVGVHDLFSVGGSLALVMDYVSGGSLRNRLTAAGTLPPSEAAGLLAQVAAALTQAHELGVVHRDVKPDNILLQEVESAPGAAARHEVRLTDFGIARVLDAAGLTTPQAIVGTPHYMAPEAIHGEAEPASDVYSVGIVLYELVTGHPPYGGEPLAVLRRHVEDAPERPPGLPLPVWELIEWCVEKDPSRRPTAGELGVALRELSRQMAGCPALTAATLNPDFAYGMTAHLGQPHPSTRRPPPRRRPRNGPRSWMWRRPGLMVALVAASVAVSGLSGYNAWHLIDAGGRPASTAQGRLPAVAVPGATPASGGPAGAAVTVPSAAPAGSLPSKVSNDQPAGLVGPGGLGGPGALPEQARGRPVAGASAGAAVSAGAAATGVQGHAKVQFGPWRCGDAYSWDVGHPVLARPCHAVGPSIRVMGQMEAAPGVQLDIALTVRDAKTREIAAGPFTCKAVMFTDFAFRHDCGPSDLDPPRGHRYVLVETWQYTERPLLPGGSAQGPEFDW